MLTLLREESTGNWTVLGRAQSVIELTRLIDSGDEYEREQTLRIDHEGWSHRVTMPRWPSGCSRRDGSSPRSRMTNSYWPPTSTSTS